MTNSFKRFITLLLGVTLVALSGHSHSTGALEIKPYIAKYRLLRKGQEHGTAERELFALNSQYRLRYESHIQWMIFSDERFESSEFIIENNQVKPLNYQMQRKGSGPDRSYQITFDRQKHEIKGAKKQRKSKSRRNKPQPPLIWNEHWLDPMSYQQQLSIDLALGKKTFDYQLINRKGKPIDYKFKVTGEEPLILPYGKVKTIRVERIYDKSDSRTIAWFAPELAYILVKIQKHKSGVEQFEIQLKELLR